MQKEKILSLIDKTKSESIIELETKPEMVQFKKSYFGKSRNPYYGKIIKKQKVRCKIIFNYEEEVNKQRVVEGKVANFVAGPNITGTVIQREPTLIKTKDNNILIQLIILENIEKKYYYHGDEISEDKIKDYLPKKSDNKSQGLDNPIILIAPSISNIVSIIYI